MNRPKRKCTMVRNDDPNSAPSTKRRRTNRPSSNLADASKISTKQNVKVKIYRPFENLPTEILEKIIEYVPVIQWADLGRVDHKFRDAITAAWGSLKKIDIQRDLLPRQRLKSDGIEKFRKKRIDILKMLDERAPNLVDLSVGCSGEETARGLSPMMDLLVRFKKLQRIDFGQDCLTSTSLGDFLRESASRDQLKEIVKMDSSIRTFDNDQLSAAFDNSNYDKPLCLETIDFAMRKPISWTFLAFVDVSRLTRFRVDNTNIPQRVLADFLGRAPQVRQLSFQFGCRYTHGSKLHQSPAANALETMLAVNMRIISAVARMEGLESLFMGSSIGEKSTCTCGNFGLKMMELLTTLGQRQSFKELGLVGQLTSSAFMNLVAPFIPKVESLRLEFGNVIAPILDAIFLPRSGLRKLHVSSNHKSAADLFNIINYVMPNAPTLESLALDLLPVRIFSRIHLEALGGLKKLRELKLNSRKDNMNDAVLKAWADGFGGNLTRLEITNCDNSITDDAFGKLLENLPNLSVLIIGNYCATDASLKKMAAASPKIEEFNFDRTKVTTAGFRHVIDGFRRLISLNLKTSNWRSNRNLKFGKYRVVNVFDS